MCRFYYEIEFMNGNKVCGHNCTGFFIEEDLLIIEGLRSIDFSDDDDINYEDKYWTIRYYFIDIKRFEFAPMRDEE